MSKPMYSGLEGKIALVTGGGRGLGKAMCLALAREGVDVALTDLKNAEQTAKEVEELGQKAMAFSANVVKEDEVKAMVDRIVAKWGRIDVLVNNVGGGHSLLLEDTPLSEWNRTLEVCLNGMFNCTKIVAEIMKKQKSGKIVNISSIAGLRMTMYGGISYSAAKAAVIGFTRHASFELGHYKINVNAVCPGTTLTEYLESLSTPEMKEEMRQATVMKDFIKPQDQADAVVFLASDRARMITGHVLVVDGGQTIPIGPISWEKFYESRKQWIKEGKWKG